MDLAVKTAETALYDEVGHEETSVNAQTLRQEQLRLEIELRDAMNSGDADRVLRLRNMLRDIPTRLVAAEVSEIRKAIDDCGERLAEIREELEYVRGLRGANNRVLAERIEAANDATVVVRRNDAAIELLNIETEGLHQTRRELKQRLTELIDAELPR